MIGPRPQVRRVVVVVVDGMRPEAIDAFAMRNVAALASAGAVTLRAQTVSPSVTAAAMTSLFTGVGPAAHGVGSAGFAIPRNLRSLVPLPRALAQAGVPTSAFLAHIPLAHAWLARQIARIAGAGDAHFMGESCTGILRAARSQLTRPWHGLVFLHWPDLDRAGHESGWMSSAYACTAGEVDSSVGELVRMLDLDADPSTLLILLSDHGGGGARPDDHESDHPLDTTIPIVLAGRMVRRTPLLPDTHLLDLPPTILQALGAPVPSSYEGRPLLEAFEGAGVAAPGPQLEARGVIGGAGA